MLSEVDIIQQIFSQFKRSKKQLNQYFESDAEILEVDKGNLLFSVDSFSTEDFFSESIPYDLGWNMACATISDILASGGNPEFYAHSITFNPQKWNAVYINKLCLGISEALAKCQVSLIGGDIGYSDSWNYTGIVMGYAEKPIMRSGTKYDDLILITGDVGIGSIYAANKLYCNNNSIIKPKALNIRNKESKLINKYAHCCIDTSDGLINSLNQLADINKVGYKVKRIPFDRDAVDLCRGLKLPIELLALSECGEYELLFCLDRNDFNEFTNQALNKKLSFTEIGSITLEPERLMDSEGKLINLKNLNIRARDYNDVFEYVKDLTTYIMSHGNYNYKTKTS